jgi:hypothetical protein
MWIIKLSPDGKIIEWQKDYNITGINTFHEPHTICQTSDGGFVLAGGSGNPFYYDAFILKLSQVGGIDQSCGFISNTNAHIIMSNLPAVDGNAQALGTAANFNVTNFSPQNSTASVILLCQATVPDPVISSLTPSSGPVYTLVTISGSNLGTTVGRVTFNGVEAIISPSLWADKEIITTVPTGATTGPVVVYTSDNRISNGYQFTVSIIVLLPFIYDIKPPFGFPSSPVEIVGENFSTQAGWVTFNGIRSFIGSWDESRILTYVPPGSTSGPVIVHAANGQDSDGRDFIVLNNYQAKLPFSVQTHWYNWAVTDQQYQEIIKNFQMVRDEAWWAQLESQMIDGQLVPKDFSSEEEWANARWSYPYDLILENCPQTINYISGYDELVKKFQAPDSPELLLLLDLFHGGLASDQNNITYDQYYDYVYHIVERYDGDGLQDMPGLVRPVKYFEIGNEPDDQGRNQGLTLENYVKKRLIPGYFAAKRANPSAFVLNAGLSMMFGSDPSEPKTYDPNWHFKRSLEDLLLIISQNNGGPNNYYMDALAFHYYYYVDNPEHFTQKIKEVRQALGEHGIKDKDIWITEYGLPTRNSARGYISEEDQASALLRLTCLMKYEKISRSFIYILKDKNSNDPSNDENVYGMLKVSCQDQNEVIREKDIMTILRVFSNKTKDLSLIDINPKNERNKGIFRLFFSNGTRNIQILWFNDIGTPDVSNDFVLVNVNLKKSIGVLYDMYGNVVRQNLPDKSPIEIGKNPQYIEY